MLSLSRCLWVPRLGHRGTRLISTGNSLGSSVAHDAIKDIALNRNQWATHGISSERYPTARDRICPRFDRSHDPEVRPDRTLLRTRPLTRRHSSGHESRAMKTVLYCRVGLKAIEFEKGKPAIAVSSLDKRPPVIDTLRTAIRNGELDQQFTEASKQARKSTKVQAGSVTRNAGSCGLALLPALPYATRSDGETSLTVLISFIAREAVHFGQCQM